MNDYTIRPMTMDDALDASELWTLVFGDDERLVFEFYRLFAHQPGFGWCAEYEGKIVAAAYCPEDMYLVQADGSEEPGAYLYAVATHPDHRERGLANAICNALKEYAWTRDTQYVFTRPSEESLYPWYAEKVGAEPCMGGEVCRFTADRPVVLPYMELLPDAYLELREKYLSGLPHVRMSIWWLKWEQLLHQFYGGGFYAIGDHIATFYNDGETIQVSELLPHPTREQAEQVCRGLMYIAGASRCVCTIHGEGQYVSCAAKNGRIPKSNPWFGPCFG